MKKEHELEYVDYLIEELEEIIDNIGYVSEDDIAFRKRILSFAKQRKSELESNFQIIKIGMRNEHNIVVDVNNWSDEFPEDICIYFENNNTILQDIAIIREHKQHDSVEVLVYADDYNEDYTHKFEIKEHNFDDDK